MFKILNFLIKKKKKKAGRVFNRLEGAPARKGVITRLAIMTPKKPNSALRHVAKINLYKTQAQIISRIPGSLSLPTKFNRVLSRGGRANDLPTVRTSVIRGVYDCSPLLMKKKRRSFYGVPRPINTVVHRRRKFRHIQF